MYLAHLMGTSTSSALEAIYGDPEKERKKKEAAAVGNPAWRADKVSISQEALELATARNVEDQAPAGLNSDGKLEDNLTENNGSFASGGTGSSIAALESKIKELQQKMVEVQRSNMPDATKEAMLSSIEAQVNAAIQELNALKTGSHE